MAYPNEELPAGRPLRTTPCYETFGEAGARFTVNHGLEVPLYFAPSEDFVENDTLGRSNAEPIVGEEVAAVRSTAGAYEIAQYARYEVAGPGAEAWLDHLVAAHIPPVGRIRLTPMLNPAGRLMGDLTIARIDEDRFWLTGSYYLQAWHMRWFHQHEPAGGVEIRNITDDWMGFSVSGPASREIVAKLVREDIANEAFPFLSVRAMDVGSAQAVVGRISLTGELGYEVVVPTSQHRALWSDLLEVGAGAGLRPIGDRAVDSLRLEKGYGIWSAEFRQENTPGESGLDRFVAFDKDVFIGRDAALRERETGASRRLVLLAVDATDADAAQDDGVWAGDRLVGLATSGAYGHHVQQSLALAYVDRDAIEAGADLTVYVVGEPRGAEILPAIPYDPTGARLRA
jgi:dimethylglycine dehydrogenase